MTKRITLTIALIVSLVLVSCVFVACKNSKISQETIEKQLVEYDGDLTITAGDTNNVQSFEYTIANVNVRIISDHLRMTSIMTRASLNIESLTYEELIAADSYLAVLKVLNLFDDYNDDDFASEDTLIKTLDVLCNGKVKIFDSGWSVSVAIDKTNSKVVIKAIRS